ncbi:hypothetical protein SUGI_1023760 [Cryptomeria japonica]|uniref:UDP-glycosyltransferase 83A1-like n=1 Tax=Cryptomeria japonica TaxID=3369 RepID=UPI0024147942|nr:UDP-glycosyltransferase 83A1-like [Cryptomeria japonica]GLJ48519.1 hypothetical protein SUGI_1023760 [Cryptomeria japonica]
MGICGEKPHALLVPFAAQGHINPMMQLAMNLVSDGFLVTFVNNEYNQSRMLESKKTAKLGHANEVENNLRMVCIPDGLPPDSNRADLSKLFSSLRDTLVSSLHKLIQDINETEAHIVTCMIVDVSLFYALDVAKQYNISSAILAPISVACNAICSSASSLVSSGIVSCTGHPKVNDMIKSFPSMAPLHSTLFPWMFGSEAEKEKQFESLMDLEKALEADWILFNSFNLLEESAIKEYPQKGVVVCPIGPLISLNILEGKSRGPHKAALWAEDVECLDWLDRQAPQSVIYAAFGSLTLLNEKQLQELASGLEATGRPFLWVVRFDLMDGTTGALPSGFVERVGDRGCFVSWAPQLSVLSHAAIACFVTHCGWNSTLESISMGVPMLSWPYFADQFINCSYIVNEWKIGFQLTGNTEGIIEKREIQDAVERLLVGEEGCEIKNRVSLLKDGARAAVREGGSSYVNYKLFIQTMKSNVKRPQSLQARGGTP